MAPVRRTRPADEDVEVVESASSSFRRTSNQKRQRLARNDESEESDETHVQTTATGNPPPTASQWPTGGNREAYEKLRDQVSDEEDDEDAVERATQDIRRQKSLHAGVQNQIADAGVVESVTCINFMCHNKLHITLGPLINFIIGHNGSGKSAVLTALTLCLGGKATSTNRGQSLKSFIKEGEESSTLIVKIKNRGDGAYRHDVYGDSIIVERHFTIQGSSGFKIKASNGRMISTKRAELDEISDYFTLQLDNPVNVLTQDMARQFLNSSSEAEKYKFFIKGVQLEQLDNDYILLSDSLDAVDAHYENMKEDLKVLKEKYRAAKAKWELSEQQSGLRDKYNRYCRQMAWVQVEEQEMHLEQRQRDVEQAQAKIADRRENATRHEEAYDQANTRHEQEKSRMEEAMASLETNRNVQTEARSSYNESKQELAKHLADQRHIADTVKAIKLRMDNIQKQIEDEKRRMEAADGGSTAMKLAEIEEAEQELAEAQRRHEDHPESLAPLQLQKRSADLKLKDAKDAVAAKNNMFQSAKSRLDTLQNSRPRPYAGYGSLPVADIRNAINAETRWRDKPVGPAAEHIKLLKPEWSTVLEGYFGGVLNSFYVTSKHDENLLSSILTRFNCRAQFPVNIGSYAPIDTTAHEPDPRFDTVLRVLEIDNVLVRNQLVINQSAEQVVLIKDRKEANSTLFDNSTASRNIKQCITLHPTLRGRGLMLQVGAGGTQKSSPINQQRNAVPRMQSDTHSQITLQNELVEQHRQDLLKVENEVQQYQNGVEAAQRAVGQHRKLEKDLKTTVDRVSTRLETLKDELEALRPGEGTLEAFKSNLSDEQGLLQHEQSQFDASVSHRDELDATTKEHRRSLESIDEVVSKAEIESGRANKDLEKYGRKRTDALRSKNEAFAEITDAERDKVTAEAAARSQQAEVEDFVRQATSICARVAIDRGETAKTLEKKLELWQAKLDQFEREIGGNREQLTADMQLKERAYQDGQRQALEIQALADRLKSSLSERHFRWRHFRTHISSRAKAGFMHLLKERAFDGKLLLNHTEKLLQLRVQPDPTQQGGQRKTQTLSGGEKSFSTICLLLALWDAMGSPIRCLDEFDVFMDSVNRDRSMKMMIHAARGSVGRQFILITPQAMGNVSAGDDIKIHKMNDPERGQTALNFGQQRE